MQRAFRKDESRKTLWWHPCASRCQFRTPGWRNTRSSRRKRGRQIDANEYLVGCSITGQGIITLDETPIRFTGPQHAETSGIETIFQVLDLLPTLGVAANYFLGREIVKPGGFRRGDESTSTAPFQRG